MLGAALSSVSAEESRASAWTTLRPLTDLRAMLTTDGPEADQPAQLGLRLSRPALTCSHCGHAAFHAGEAQLNTQGLTFLGLDWLNGTADYFACARCGHLHWFLQVMP